MSQQFDWPLQSIGQRSCHDCAWSSHEHTSWGQAWVKPNERKLANKRTQINSRFRNWPLTWQMMVYLQTIICPGQVFVKEPAVFHSHWSCTQRVSCSFRVNSRLWWQESNPSLQTRTASRTNSPNWHPKRAFPWWWGPGRQQPESPWTSNQLCKPKLKHSD